VTKVSTSDTILSNMSCEAGVITCTGKSPNGLSDAINANTMDVLMAQTLATSYNIQKISGYSGQTVAVLNCQSYVTSPLTALGLSGSSTVNNVLSVANSLIGGSIAGGTTTQAQASAMNALLSCLNRESF
jgi:hypothetical protein